MSFKATQKQSDADVHSLARGSTKCMTLCQYSLDIARAS